MTMMISAALMLAAAVPGPTQANENALGREYYDSLVQCAAFHSVEAGMTREGGDAAASHLATANDYRADARKHSADGNEATADADIQTAITLYTKMLKEGDPVQMAKGWTSLESACRELHIVKGQLAAKPTQENSR
jgi:hypothetical protein